MDFKDYYKVLGLEPGADDKAVKTAYRKLARKYHPDVSKESDAEDKFKDVAEAYEVLKSTEKRAEYDELLKYGPQGPQFEPPPGWQPRTDSGYANETDGARDYSDFFESIFGGAQHSRRRAQSHVQRGQDVEMQLPVLLEETLSEETKKIAFQLPQYSANGQPLPAINKTLNVKIPAGVSDGERIRLKDQGAPGIGGAANGDLYLIIRFVPHPLFDIEGHNLIVTVPVAPWEAVLGGQATVPTLEGKINLRIPANSQNGQRLRIKSKGLLNKRGERGDMYALFKIVIPAHTNEQTRALWTQLAEQAAFNPRAEWGQ